MAIPTKKSQPARTLEADGATAVTFGFRGAEVTIPLAVEDWPLDEIRAGKPGRAVRILLGDQRPPMSTRGDVLELSARMADAVGVTPLPGAPASMFGAVPAVIDIVDNHGDDLEADLLRYYRVDYRRPPAAGGPTLRQIWVYVRRLPGDSAVMMARNAGETPWTRGDILAARLWESWTGRRYTGRPISSGEIAEWKAREAANAAEMDKLKGREGYYASGQNMRDAGMDPGPRQQQPPAQRVSPTAAALTVAERNARRSPTGETTNGRRPAAPGQRRWGYDPRGSGWG